MQTRSNLDKQTSATPIKERKVDKHNYRKWKIELYKLQQNELHAKIFMVCRLFHFEAQTGAVFVPSATVAFISACFTLAMIDIKK